MYLFHGGLVVLITLAIYLIFGKFLPLSYPFHPAPAILAGLLFLITAVFIVKGTFGTIIVVSFILGLLLIVTALFLGNNENRF